MKSTLLRSLIVTTIGFLGFWISIGLFRGGPWKGVIIACALTLIIMPLCYLYGIWLSRKLSGNPHSDDHDSQ